MRRPLLTGKKFCERCELFEENCRCLSGELAKITDQMSLIVISAIGGDPRPIGVRLLYGAKYLLKSEDPAQEFRAESDYIQKSALELTAGNTDIVG